MPEIELSEQFMAPQVDLADLILSSYPAVICAKDLQGRYLYVNPVLTALTGKSAQDFIGKTDVDIFSPDRADYYLKTDQVVHRSGKTLKYQEVGASAIEPYTVTKYPLRSSDGTMFGVVSYAEPTDSHESSGVEGAQSDFLQRAFSRVPQAVLICEGSGRIIAVNGPALSLMQNDAAGVISKPISAFIPNHETIARSDDSAHTPERVAFRRMDGSTFPAALTSLRIDVTNDVRWTLFTFRDCSEEVRVESELRENERRFAVELLRSQEEERRRIAHDLHDGLAQSLLAISLGLVRLKGATEHNIRAEDTLDELYALTQSALREVRTLSYVLQPPFDERGGLSGTIEWLLQGFERRSGLKVSYERPEAPSRLTEATEVALFRVLQESLSNVVRHAQATCVTVRFLQDPEGISLEIEDDGTAGIDDRGPSVGVGLASMRGRMYEVGGTFEIRGTTRGTLVRATVPTIHPQ